MITPKKMRKAANRLREIVDFMEELGGTPGWPLLIGFDLDFLADEFDKHAKRLEQADSRVVAQSATEEWFDAIEYGSGRKKKSHREPPPAGYRAGGPNG